jgi:sucrose phosphorylase
MRTLPAENMRRIRARLEGLYGPRHGLRLLARVELLAGRYGSGTQECTDPWPQDALWDQRDAVLITYGDMLRAPNQKPLDTLRRFLDARLRGAVNTVHILPFFPYSSDDGFSVIDYREVDPALGGWEQIHALGEAYCLMFDLVLNHVSSHSTWFRNYTNGVAPERHYFIEVDPQTDLSAVVRPRPHPLLASAKTPGGERHVWTTFSADQVDLDFSNSDVLFEFLDILMLYVRSGARIVRLDAIAYLWKTIGTSCVNLPQTHEVVKLMRDVLEMLAPGTILLTETNLPHKDNISYFGDADEAHMVYQFSLPPLLLHALHTGTTCHLVQWAASLAQLPAGCAYFNFTASHDGIGVRPLEGLVPDSELQDLVDAVCQRGGQVSTRTVPGGSVRPYELNITYFDALSDPQSPVSDAHIARFLCSQTVMLSLKGIPGVYFHSLTATRNDYLGVEHTGQPRSINRMRWSERQLNEQLADPSTHTARVFSEYDKRLRLRAAHPAFHPDGPQTVLDLEDGLFGLLRRAPDDSETVLAISNLGAEPRTLDIGSLTGADNHGHDLLSGNTLHGKIDLPPYESLWLALDLV